MPRPLFLKSLPRSASIAYDFIRSGVRQGISARAMESTIRSTLTPISRTTINAVVRGVKGIEDTTVQYKFLKKDARPDPARFTISRSDIATEFSYTVRRNGLNPFTFQPEETFTQVVSDELLSLDELEFLAEDTAANDEGSPDLVETVYTLESVLQRA